MNHPKIVMKYLQPKELIPQTPSFNTYKQIIHYKKIPEDLH